MLSPFCDPTIGAFLFLVAQVQLRNDLDVLDAKVHDSEVHRAYLQLRLSNQVWNIPNPWFSIGHTFGIFS